MKHRWYKIHRERWFLKNNTQTVYMKIKYMGKDDTEKK